MTDAALDVNDRYRALSLDAGQTDLPYDFPLLAETDLTVLLERGGEMTPLTEGVDFIFPLGLGTDAGGTAQLVVAAQADDVYHLVGEEAIERVSEFMQQQGFDTDKLDADIDKLTRIAQEARRDIDRSLKVAFGDQNLDPLPAPEADTVLGWSADLKRIVNKAIVSTGALLMGAAGLAIAAFDVPADVRSYLDAPALVANRALLKQLDHAKDAFAVIRSEGGRNGLFRWDGTDRSADVDADVQQGIFVAPQSDPSGVSGAWVREFDGWWNIEWFGAVHNGATDDAAAFAGVVSLASDVVQTICLMPAGTYRQASEVHVSKPVLFQGEGQGQITKAANNTGVLGTTIQWSGAAGGRMFTLSKQSGPDLLAGITTGDIIFGGGFNGLALHGNSTAAVGVWAASTNEAQFKVQVSRFKEAGIYCDGGNGALSVRNEFDVHVVYGALPEVEPMHGVVVREFNGGVSTQNTFWRVWGLIQDGDMVRLENTDNNILFHIHGANGAGGTGNALSFRNGVTSDARNNVVYYVSGDIKAESATKGNRVFHANSEGQKISIDPGGQMHYENLDYIKEELFRTHSYRLRDMPAFPAGAFQSVSATRGRLASLWDAQLFSGAADQIICGTFGPFHDWNDGRIVGFSVSYGLSADPAGSALRLRIQAETATSGVSAATPDTDETFTIVPVYNAFFRQEVTLTLTTPLAVTKGDVLLLDIRRLAGTDAADTSAADMAFLSIQPIFVGEGPDSPGSGPNDVPPPGV